MLGGGGINWQLHSLFLQDCLTLLQQSQHTNYIVICALMFANMMSPKCVVLVTSTLPLIFPHSSPSPLSPQTSSDYDHQMLMQKVEVFEQAINSTSGDDLAKVLWLKSPSSEVWFDRRTNCTCFLAVMSMVGYILGLGDRWALFGIILLA